MNASERIFPTIKRLGKTNSKILIIASLGFAFLAFIDVVATILIALTANLALSLSGNGAKNFSDQNNLIRHMLGNNPNSQRLFLFVAFATFLLLVKSVLGFFAQKTVMKRLRHNQINMARQVFQFLSARQYKTSRIQDSQTLLYALTDSLTAMLLEVTASLIIIISEGILLVSYIIILLRVDATIMIVMSLTLVPILWFTTKSINTKSAKYGRETYENSLEAKKNLRDGIKLSSELMLLGRINFITGKYLQSLARSSSASAKLILINQAPKYLLEIMSMVILVAMSGMILASNDVKYLAGKIVIFLLATGRIFPSFLRFQGAMIAFSASSGKSKVFSEVINSEEYKKYTNVIQITDSPTVIHNGLIELVLKNVLFSYPENNFKLTIPMLVIDKPGFYVISGPSGIGKSTFCNLLLGITNVDSGEILIQGASPRVWISMHPGTIAFATQDDNLISGSILENICLGLDEELIDQSLLANAIELCGLTELLASLSSGINTQIGEDGSKLSGGQRKKISLARSLYSNPKILILDEPTSSLDFHSEKEIISLISQFSKERIVLVVSHSRTVIENADRRILALKKNGETTFSLGQ